jgi:hypothetical protein
VQLVKIFIIQFFKSNKWCNTGLVKTKLAINNGNIPVAGSNGVSRSCCQEGDPWHATYGEFPAALCSRSGIDVCIRFQASNN